MAENHNNRSKRSITMSSSPENPSKRARKDRAELEEEEMEMEILTSSSSSQAQVSNNQMEIANVARRRVLTRFEPDGMMNLFLRLTDEDLCACVNVCSEWSKIIREPEFIYLHLRRNLLKSSILQIVSNGPLSSLHCIIDDPNTNELRLTTFRPRLQMGQRIRDSCHGILVLSQGQTISLLNPLSKKKLEIMTNQSFEHVALCFDQIHFIYKLFFIRENPNSLSKHDQIICQFFIFGEEGTWNPPRIVDYLDSAHIITNGKIHFLCGLVDQEVPTKVCSVDISSESIEYVSFQALVGPLHQYDASLILLGESLSLCLLTPGRIQIWSLIVDKWEIVHNLERPMGLRGNLVQTFGIQMTNHLFFKKPNELLVAHLNLLHVERVIVPGTSFLIDHVNTFLDPLEMVKMQNWMQLNFNQWPAQSVMSSVEAIGGIPLQLQPVLFDDLENDDGEEDEAEDGDDDGDEADEADDDGVDDDGDEDEEADGEDGGVDNDGDEDDGEDDDNVGDGDDDES